MSLPMISNVNKLKNISSLKNSFFALRHGQSLANVAKIISSDPSISTVEHGLSDIGKAQVASSADLFAQQYLDNKDTQSIAIFSSDFTRARETAEIFADKLRDSNVPLQNNCFKLETKLRERYFGDFNGKSDVHYQEVWNIDCHDANHNKFNCESVNSVVIRTSELILEIEKELEESNEQACKMEACIDPWHI
eukprot:scaffold424_cov127-Chaetoceros_neogracile.AAC.4